MNVCHRIMVMSGGRIRDELTEPEFSEQRILAAAFAAHMADRGRRTCARGSDGGRNGAVGSGRTAERAAMVRAASGSRLALRHGREIVLPLVVAVMIAVFSLHLRRVLLDRPQFPQYRRRGRGAGRRVVRADLRDPHRRASTFRSARPSRSSASSARSPCAATAIAAGILARASHRHARSGWCNGLVIT